MILAHAANPGGSNFRKGQRDISTIDETLTPTAHFGFHDLLIAMLVEEVDELLHGGLARRYSARSERMASPRGRILFNEIIRGGGITEARLPCRHFERSVDWHLNRVLRAGLGAAALMTQDRELRRRIHRLSDLFGEVAQLDRLAVEDIDRAERGLTRLTAANAAALTIIRLLKDMQGVILESAEGIIQTPGFLFDMNRFFQALLLRFLKENTAVFRIEGERAIANVFNYSADANPRRRGAPKPRPDYALFQKNEVYCFADAKYRDVWEKGLPAEWLYQLSIYALASPAQVSILLYATTATQARDERIEIRQPVVWSNKGPALVILRPVLLPKLAELVRPGRNDLLARMQRRFADGLLMFDSRAANGARDLAEQNSSSPSRTGSRALARAPRSRYGRGLISNNA
jgi:5-methylcytosine-specific restriction enzyme subunit McrC